MSLETEAAPAARLSGRLGVTSIVFMVIAAAAPLTVINGNVPLAVTMGNGAGAPIGFLVASCVLLLFCVGFVAMTPHVQQAGAFYAYVERGLGPRLGTGAAFLALATYTAIQVGVWGYLGGAVSTLISDFGGPSLPWWACSAVGIALVALLGYRRIELSSKVLGAALLGEIAIVLVIIGVFYTFSAWAVVEGWGAGGIVPVAQQDPDNLVLNTATRYIGTAGKDVMQVLLMTSLFACTLSFHNVISRYQFTLAGRGTLHRALGRVHPHHHSPSLSSVAQTATAAVLLSVFAIVGLDPLTEVFSAMAGVATLGVALLMTATSAAVLVFFFRRGDRRWWKTRVAPASGTVGLLCCLWLILSNFSLVVGGTTAAACFLGAIPFLAFALGLLRGGGHRGTHAVPGSPEELAQRT